MLDVVKLSGCCCCCEVGVVDVFILSASSSSSTSNECRSFMLPTAQTQTRCRRTHAATRLTKLAIYPHLRPRKTAKCTAAHMHIAATLYRRHLPLPDALRPNTGWGSFWDIVEQMLAYLSRHWLVYWLYTPWIDKNTRAVFCDNFGKHWLPSMTILSFSHTEINCRLREIGIKFAALSFNCVTATT